MIRLTNTKFASKYRNQPQIIDGIRFAAKAEARRYEHWKTMQAAGVITHFLLQVPFHIPGYPKAVRYVVDFVVFFPDGHVKYEDVKGYATRIFKIKQAIVQKQFKITIETVK